MINPYAHCSYVEFHADILHNLERLKTVTDLHFGLDVESIDWKQTNRVAQYSYSLARLLEIINQHLDTAK